MFVGNIQVLLNILEKVIFHLLTDSVKECMFGIEAWILLALEQRVVYIVLIIVPISIAVAI